VHTSWSHPNKEHRLVVVGDAGTAVFEDSQPDWNKRLAFYQHGIDRAGPVPVPIKAAPNYIEVEPGEPLRLECQHFVECIANGRQPRTNGREGLQVLDVLERAEASLTRSLENGQP
jgi:UDP-2-acetamido-3-amino-2,3-dideoxy-glucuronate N-acetyltransferase